MGKEQKRDVSVGPTDKAIRPFHDTYNEETRYDHKEKRRRRMEREKLKRVKNMGPNEREDY